MMSRQTIPTGTFKVLDFDTPATVNVTADSTPIANNFLKNLRSLVITLNFQTKDGKMLTKHNLKSRI